MGEELTLSPKVDLISFTGSTAVGKRIMEKGAATMKRLFLELGGKSATIVLEDADLALSCLIGIAPCMHAGQGCAMPTRMLLPRSRYDEGVEILKGIYESVVPGDPQQPGRAVRTGDLGQAARPCHSAISRRASTRVPRSWWAAPGCPRASTRASTCAPLSSSTSTTTMTIAREEIFGPVLVVIPFEDEADALRIANDSPYGLAGNVMSGSLERSLAVARKLRAGFIGLNGGAGYFADVPFGGYKESGVGRQNGIAGFEQYLEVKSVAWPAG